MAQPIIEIEGLGKSYRIGANRERYLSLRDEMAKQAHGFYRRFLSRHRHLPKDEEFWALKDVSFSVQAGEAVGIIGRNGAGKSTLLKVLSRITPPTHGKITLRGRMASLLEVGTGFHPELTGRENIYLNGAILGMTRAEIKRKFDEIVAFAEVEQFLDTPVKRYSSGMYVRLAFAVAAHLEPEILVVDEVLAVGDAQFQEKCLGRMDEVAKEGRTVLFVSHNMAAISKLCRNCILLRSGTVQGRGATEKVIEQYLDQSAGSGGVAAFDGPAVPYGKARFTKCCLVGGNGEPKDVFMVGEKMEVRIAIHFPITQRGVKLTFNVKSLSKGYVYHVIASDEWTGAADFIFQGDYEFVATFEKNKLYPGNYTIDDLYMANSLGVRLDLRPDVLLFRVEQGGPYVKRAFATQAGIVHEVPDWSLRKLGLEGS
jgi:lipopolysaccharide transport system ATP-binding protein